MWIFAVHVAGCHNTAGFRAKIQFWAIWHFIICKTCWQLSHYGKRSQLFQAISLGNLCSLLEKQLRADSFHLLAFWRLTALNTTEPAHEKKQQLWEENGFSSLVGIIMILSSTCRGMTISVQQIWTRTKHLAFRKLPWVYVSWQVNMPSGYSAQRTCWAPSDPAKLALWRRCCVIASFWRAFGCILIPWKLWHRQHWK